MRPLALLLFLAFLTPASSYADNTLPKRLAQGLKQLSDSTGFASHFKQTLHFSDNTVQNHSGELAILRPHRFLWRYIKPYEQLFISNGKRIWHYEPDLMQVRILQDIESIDPVVIQLLEGRIDLNDLQLLDQDTKNHRFHIRMGKSQKFWIAFHHDGHLLSLESKDVLGNINTIHFLQVEHQPPDKKMFEFSIPAGVDVVE
ncbi:MAG: outer-membrane lipoprotein carrier protein LolA [Mariprofundaceae bacterium]